MLLGQAGLGNPGDDAVAELDDLGHLLTDAVGVFGNTLIRRYEVSVEEGDYGRQGFEGCSHGFPFSVGTLVIDSSR